MPPKWNIENDGRILLGVVSQLKDLNVTLDMDKVASFIGPEFTANSVRYRISRLKKQAEEGLAENDHTPTNTPQKRKLGPRTPAKKRQKNITDEEGNSMDASSADMSHVVIAVDKEEEFTDVKDEKVKTENKVEIIYDSDGIKELGIKGEKEDTKQGIKAESDDDFYVV
ncbi:hypothetical protein N7499_000319 [Penicillium canescens]|uniref:Uncharacterized protein n=1 Tax=Penicillium canescens TaxID=5083 RepID=A0AAD6IHK4_PENCN|nr:uncharacterized protein N7446_011482 [Penicillium canescens]KAJ6004250.1 hypothetical protein N7522_005895 [Penicillium canescens]KAJ6029174.1 hypothetical protein N7444_012161 [Penicillium canescens]KAJ6047605.1 hypothetical protein N7460_003752 [Penicillium canescens]KAJ6048799.1 hypothetical protein N7446_011482 [Penicillium canescens]KAJ6100689.1 hypothetical protein N7499_000319 [Penicillium canescens]